MKKHKYIYMEFSLYKTIKISNVYETMRRLTVYIILLEKESKEIYFPEVHVWCENCVKRIHPT